MVRRIAGTLSLLAFAVCLLAGMGAGNSTATVLSNALLALAVTFVVGLVVGVMAQKMLDENVAAESAKAAAPPEGGARAGGDEKK
jgi:tetrahydromethanopterin S-methyltransferase subunit C